MHRFQMQMNSQVCLKFLQANLTCVGLIFWMYLCVWNQLCSCFPSYPTFVTLEWPSLWTLWWFLTSDFVLNAASQLMHLWGFIFLWTVSSCFFKSDFVLNLLLHREHWKGLSSVWVSRWRFILSADANLILQIGHS